MAWLPWLLALVWACALASSTARAQADAESPPATAPDAAPEPPPQALEHAREALDAGDPARAAELAEAQVAADPHDVDGWTVLGLSRFAQGDAAAALAHFERALSLEGGALSGDARAVVQFNRAACLFDLGRFEQAERGFVEAGAGLEAPMSVLAALNAGFAAVELGALDRARAHLDRADALDVDDALGPARDELAAELGPTLRDAGGGGDAVGGAEPAAAADGLDAYQRGVEAYRSGDDHGAREHFERARELGLGPIRDHNARAYLDALAGGLRSVGRGWGASASVAAGFDSNAAQSGLGDATAPLTVAQAEQGSGFVSAGAEVGYGASLSGHTFALGEYSLEQNAYLEGDLDLFSSQDHTLELGVEHSPSALVRYGASGRALLSIAGIETFEPLSWTAGGDAWLTLDYGQRFDTTLRGSVLSTREIDEAFSFLAGTRVEAAVIQRLHRRSTRAGVELRYRVEGLGTQHIVTTNRCGGCLDIYDIPLSYQGPGASAWLSQRLASWLRAGLRGRVEWRSHDGTSRLEVVMSALDGRTGVLHERTQRDRRAGLSAGLTFVLGGAFDLYAGYDLTVASSNIDNTAGGDHELDYGNLNYLRHVLELELGALF